MSIAGEFERHLLELIRRLRCAPGPDAEALASRLEAVAADRGEALSTRARRILEALEAAPQAAGDNPEARDTVTKVCSIILGR